ncbi:hypothetical protein B296_00043278 [Ensete ventricosum]|uniref:Uncharacterized protein n=1 Tax=Ensete ventricosum TaxID=4639 RepID=A0A426XCU4_ENSVE|nr:hypothetical protein B296_00043278 [Ensete ventricosum]
MDPTLIDRRGLGRANRERERLTSRNAPSNHPLHSTTHPAHSPRQSPLAPTGVTEYPDHDDALVISACIANTRVKSIMIDIGSSTAILYFDTFLKLGMTNHDLTPMTSTLTGFTGDEITPVGVATLPMTSDNEPRTKILMVPFMVVELPSAYNVSIGRPTLNKLRAVVSTYHRSKPNTRPEPIEPILECP